MALSSIKFNMDSDKIPRHYYLEVHQFGSDYNIEKKFYHCVRDFAINPWFTPKLRELFEHAMKIYAQVDNFEVYKVNDLTKSYNQFYIKLSPIIENNLEEMKNFMWIKLNAEKV